MKKPGKLFITGIILICAAILLSIILPSMLKDQIDTQINEFEIGSTVLKDVRGNPPFSPTGEVPFLMGNLTFLSLLWDKILGENRFPWNTYRYLPTIEMIDLLSKEIAIDSQGLYLPETETSISLITEGTLQELFDSKKLYRDQGFDIYNLEKKNYSVEDLFTSEELPVFFQGETEINDINTYIFRGYRNTSTNSIGEVLDLFKVQPEIFINESKNITNGGPTVPLQQRFSSLINTTLVTEKQIVHYYMAEKLGVPLNIMVDYDIYVDFPLISELMLNDGFIKPILDGNITINPLFRPLVDTPGEIKQVVFFNTSIAPDDPSIAIVHQSTYFANGTTGERLPHEFQLNRSPVFAVDRETLAYTSYPGTMNRTGLFLPPCQETTPRSITLWDEVTNTSGIAYYMGTLNRDNDTLLHYTLYQENVVFTDIPLFHNISTLLNLDILYDGTTTYVLNQTTRFLYDIIFQGEFKLVIPLTLLPLEIPLGNLYLSFNSTLKEFMKEASRVINDFKHIEGTSVNAGTLHLEYTPALTNYFSSLQRDALQWITLFNFWFPLALGIIGGVCIIGNFHFHRRKNKY